MWEIRKRWTCFRKLLVLGTHGSILYTLLGPALWRFHQSLSFPSVSISVTVWFHRIPGASLIPPYRLPIALLQLAMPQMYSESAILSKTSHSFGLARVHALLYMRRGCDCGAWYGFSAAAPNEADWSPKCARHSVGLDDIWYDRHMCGGKNCSSSAKLRNRLPPEKATKVFLDFIPRCHFR